MTTARITAVMLDGTKHEGTGVWQALADRVAFERKFPETIGQMRKRAREDGTDGKLDFSAVKDEQVAYFCWRLLRRAEIPVGEFEKTDENGELIGGFLHDVEEIKIDLLDGPADPTVADQLPGN